MEQRAPDPAGRGEAATEAAQIFDRAAATYDRAGISFFTPFGEALVEHARLTADERALDAGCGAGAVLLPASKAAGEVVGIDISPAMADRAREAVPDARVEVGDVTELPFEDESFDVVLSAFVVFFLDDPAAGLREWRRVLRPGGRVAISTWAGPDPRWSWERELRKDFVDRMPKEILPRLAASLERLARFDEPGKAEAELRAAGFEDPVAEPHEIEFRFPDEQAWWDWSMSHAGRAAFEALPADARESYRERAFDAMQELRADDGSFPRVVTALFAAARRPG